jgi:hypothetical protein
MKNNRLPGCGHAYCESCLVDWFSTTQAKHVAQHPQYMPGRPQHPLMQAQYLRHLPITPQQRYEMENILSPIPKPQFTCPTCRAEVRTAPVESFNLKAAVRAVAKAEGERSPSKEFPKSRRGKAPVRNPGGIWDGFFPKPPGT